MQVSEITAPTAGHQDFFTHLVGAFQYQHAPTPPGRSDRTHQPGSTCANNNKVKVLHRRALWRQSTGYAQSCPYSHHPARTPVILFVPRHPGLDPGEGETGNRSRDWPGPSTFNPPGNTLSCAFNLITYTSYYIPTRQFRNKSGYAQKKYVTEGL